MRIETWKKRGFINNNITTEKQLELSKNLDMGKNLIQCDIILNGEFDFYKEVEFMLYPIIIYYTTEKNSIFVEGGNIIHKFIEFCNNNLRVKYYLDKYNDDYLLCQEFIQLN